MTPAPGLCVFHTETLCCLYREYTISIEQKYCLCRTEILSLQNSNIVSLKQKYCLCRTEIQVLACQIWDKIMEFGPNHVHMAPFGLILIRFGSHRV